MNYPYGNMNMNSYSQYPQFGGGYNPPVPDQLSQLRMQNAFNQMNPNTHDVYLKASN